MLGGRDSPIQALPRQFPDLCVPNLPRVRSATPMEVLVVTNFVPDAGAPQRGRWVRDQIREIERRGVAVEVFSFPPGSRQYIPATRRLRRLLRERSFDLVHAHYGLPGWCALLAGARPLVVSFHGTDVRHGVVGPLSRRLAWRADLTAAVSKALYAPENGRPGLPRIPGAAVLPCGPDLERFGPMPRAEARRRLDLEPEGRYLLFPANPDRPEKRADRAAELAAACGAELLSGGSIEPDADAALDQRRQRRRRHLRLRGLRHGLPRGARLRGAGALDPGRHRALRPGRHRGRPLRPLRPRLLVRPRRAPARRRATRGSRAPGAPRRSPRGRWRNARSRPIATFSRPRNRLEP